MSITPEFLFDLESNMRVIAEEEFNRLSQDLWWTEVAKTMPSSSKKEIVHWLLSTAKIVRPNASHGGGQAIFEDQVMETTEFENENATAGLELQQTEFADLDGNGLNLATEWASQIGSLAAYWPQKVIAEAIRNNPNTYDDLPFFSAIGAPHPVNPFNVGAGTFANDLTGAAAGSYPGAVPVNGVTVDVALENLTKVRAYVAGFKMPNGEDPRKLRINKILCPPALTFRLEQLTQAKFIAQAAAAGGGASDVEAAIRRNGLGTVIEVPELGAEFGGSDTTYYVLTETITTNQLGAFIYVDRQPFSINFHGEMTDAQLARMQKMQWTVNGRNTVGAGHPYLMLRCQAT